MDVNKRMKPIFKEEFWCPQCGKIRYVYIDGICDYCRNVNILEELTKQRKLRHAINAGISQLKIKSYS